MRKEGAAFRRAQASADKLSFRISTSLPATPCNFQSMSPFRSLLIAILVLRMVGGDAAWAEVPGNASFAPTSGEQGKRRDLLMDRLHQRPYPESGPWHFVGQALGSYWVGDSAAGNAAIDALAGQAVAPETAAGEESGFHWQAFQIARIVLLFGARGSYRPGVMAAQEERLAKGLLWAWVEPRARRVLTDVDKDWWVWGSENHHLQAWISLWSSLVVFDGDPDYATRKFADGSTVPELKKAFDEYFKRWVRNRATRGLFVECNSPTYAKYSLSALYNLVDFADDSELRRLTVQFLDLTWAQWALEQIDGVRGGSRHRCYQGDGSVLGATAANLAWIHFGLGEARSAHPSTWCTATSGYAPPDLVARIVHERASLGPYEIDSRQPGLADPAAPAGANYVDDPKYPFFVKQGVYTLDPACRSLLRRTYATESFVIGCTMLPALPLARWTSISSQNRWDGILLAGPGTPRIFVQPLKPETGSAYNAQWAVQQKGVMIVQKIRFAKGAPDQRVWISNRLTTEEKGGWIFARAAKAYVAIKIAHGESSWEEDSPAAWRNPGAFTELGRWLVLKDSSSPIVFEVSPQDRCANFGAFQEEILSNTFRESAGVLEYHSAQYQTALTLFEDGKRSPLIDGTPVNYEPPACFAGELLQGSFGGSAVTLKAFGEEHIFDFSARP